MAYYVGFVASKVWHLRDPYRTDLTACDRRVPTSLNDAIHRKKLWPSSKVCPECVVAEKKYLGDLKKQSGADPKYNDRQFYHAVHARRSVKHTKPVSRLSQGRQELLERGLPASIVRDMDPRMVHLAVLEFKFR